MKVRMLGANQTEVELDAYTVVLFSYETPVAARLRGKLYRVNVRYSKTTSKHINQWLESMEAEGVTQEWFNELIEGRM